MLTISQIYFVLGYSVTALQGLRIWETACFLLIDIHQLAWPITFSSYISLAADTLLKVLQQWEMIKHLRVANGWEYGIYGLFYSGLSKNHESRIICQDH